MRILSYDNLKVFQYKSSYSTENFIFKIVKDYVSFEVLSHVTTAGMSKGKIY